MKQRIIIFTLIVLTGMTIAVVMNMQHYSDEPDSPVNRSQNNRLKVINPSDVNPKLVDPEIQDVTKDHTISDFSFQNQLGDTITKADVVGKIFVTDFFFTTCAGICPKMTTQLKRVQAEFKNDPNFLILSHTVNPSIDTVETMRAYAERFDADPEKWWFLTGSKHDLYIMARKSYLVVPDEADPDFDHGGESDFLHTENFALIDPDGRIRGMYDGTNPEEVDELIRDVYDLKKEYELD
ncbi:SCO family protein [Paracrocinitomix mangrovi]|uniref:SCO family protein n=1 Tax=Paracrocinitomix mangrovi TaxID=2862509 RepID=UPI001C8DDEE0|nr:SCO family protein [Paracrocinitomix mangrovi]UKN00566.1 SCO family protein [Paracrocinitomix mangrovi]